MHLSKFIRIASLLAGSIALSSLASASILITLDVARLESENIFTVTSTNSSHSRCGNFSTRTNLIGSIRERCGYC
jgi:hypothetical protein